MSVYICKIVSEISLETVTPGNVFNLSNWVFCLTPGNL